MWNSRKEFRDWIKSLDSSSIIANRILCEDKLGLFKDYSKSTRMWMTRVMNMYCSPKAMILLYTSNK